MFKVETADGSEKYLVQLVGPRSYRMGAQMTHRGQTLTVSKRTRDYLVRKTSGAWVDFDPTPPEPIDEILPPQFGEYGGPQIDMDDIDPKKNPALSMEHAKLLAEGGSEVPTNAAGNAFPRIDPEDLGQAPTGAVAVPDGSGDMTGADLKKTSQAQGGKTATAAKPGAVKFAAKATPVTAKPGAMTVE